MTCDYCAEGLPFWHRREADEYGLEGAQFMPCEKQRLSADEIVTLLSRMIDAGMSREDVALVRDLAL